MSCVSIGRPRFAQGHVSTAVTSCTISSETNASWAVSRCRGTICSLLVLMCFFYVSPFHSALSSGTFRSPFRLGRGVMLLTDTSAVPAAHFALCEKRRRGGGARGVFVWEITGGLRFAQAGLAEGREGRFFKRLPTDSCSPIQPPLSATASHKRSPSAGGDAHILIQPHSLVLYRRWNSKYTNCFECQGRNISLVKYLNQ